MARAVKRMPNSTPSTSRYRRCSAPGWEVPAAVAIEENIAETRGRHDETTAGARRRRSKAGVREPLAGHRADGDDGCARVRDGDRRHRGDPSAGHDRPYGRG